MAYTFTLPTIFVTPDPTWAQELNEAIQQIADNRYEGSEGQADKLSQDSILISGNVEFNNNAILEASYLQLVPQTPPSVLNSIFPAANGDLYYTNSNNVQVQITNGTQLNQTTATASKYEVTNVTTNISILNTDTFTYLNVSTAAARTIFLPAASSVNAGRFYYIKDATGSAFTNNITIDPAGADTINTVAANKLLNKAFGTWLLESDGTSNWNLSYMANQDMQDGTFISSAITMQANSAQAINLNVGTASLSISDIGSNVSITSNSHELTILASAMTLQTSGAVPDIILDAARDIILDAADDVTLIAADAITSTATTTNTLAGATVNITATGDINITATDDGYLTATDDVFISAGDSCNLSATSFEITTTGTAAVNLNSPIKLANTGRYCFRRILSQDANMNLSPADGNIMYVSSSTLSADRTYTIVEASNPQTGDNIFISNFSATRSIVVKDPNAATITTLGTQQAGLFVRGTSASSWICVDKHAVVAI